MLDVIGRKLDGWGLRVRGILTASGGADLPEGVGTLILIGHLGREMWPEFQKQRQDEPDPLDSWTRRVIGPLARDLGAGALYPFDGPPWHPFQRWSMAAEGLGQSPIGPLIHPVYGPWHGYRAALTFRQALPARMPPATADICAGCQAKPCLKACPTRAFRNGGYDVAACLNHMKEPGSLCLAAGCLARRACSVGRGHAYSGEQGGFHARAFLAFMDSRS